MSDVSSVPQKPSLYATCSVCPHACRLGEGERGVCGARQASGGAVEPLNYGRSTALALDPIEKKPLACFHPGSTILSYGSFGCNLSCAFCQNWEIAHSGKETKGETKGDGSCVLVSKTHEPSPFVSLPAVSSRYIAPEELVEQAVALKSRGNIGIALTYNEPLVCPEYIVDVGELAHDHGLQLVLVTNGYVLPEVARQVFAVVDAANIDLKAFNQDFYTLVGAPAGLATVKRTIQTALAEGCHVEVTTLVIPALNDSREEMRAEASWLASLSPDIPLHISRFHPAYNMTDRQPTPRSTILELAGIAREYLTQVFTGNM